MKECLTDIVRLIRQHNAYALTPRMANIAEEDINKTAIHLILKYSQMFVKRSSKVYDWFD